MKTLKKALAIFLATIMALGVMSVSALAEDEIYVSGEVVSFVGVTIELPEDGVEPSNYHTLDSEEYELIDLTWTDVEANEVIFSSFADSLIETKPFEEGKTYEAKIVLYAASGYVFDLEPEELIVSVNGYVAEIEEISLLGKKLVVTCEFECTSDVFEGDDGSTSVTFDQILDLLKTTFITFLRFLGTLIGIK